ncbi:Rep [uncultured virus]|uniref:ATP-dependent helicase Rep n=1 Tax=uncultured virus TaxID=340016 RepID=A0A2K9LS92_9VIRU|nr:Rep [uncultured virus]
MSRSPNWCFSILNWSEDDVKVLDNLNCSFITYGKEICPTTGTPHIHVYVEFPTKKRWGAVRDIIPERSAKLEPRFGTQEDAINYVQKDGEYVVRGNKKNQGSRSDLDGVRVMALECGMREVTRYRNAQQIRVAKDFLTYNEEPRTGKPFVVWFWGPTGGGKTRRAHEMAADDGGDVYVKHGDSKWFDGYDAHEIVIFDDIRDDTFKFNYLLNLLDPYPVRVECKGSSRQFKPRLIIITCPYEPINFLGASFEDRNQLLRRLDVVERVWSGGPEVAGNNWTATSTPLLGP